jgi:putative nucleotidyltransferase with HDIG domain
MGRRGGISVAIFSIALVVYFVVLSPTTYLTENDHLRLTLNLTLWGCLLILTSTIVGGLYEQNEKKYGELNKELNTAYEGVLEILVKFIGSVDKYTQDHSQRVAELTTEMALCLKLPERQTETLRVAALLHDIGKVDVSSDVILKMTKLSEKELRELKTHVEKGELFLKPFQRLFKDAVNIVLTHHKYYDNSGYGGENIVLDQHSQLSLGIVTIADAYDAMISDRPYRSGKTPRQAVAEIKGLSGKQFDPMLVKVFMDVMQDRLESN